MIPLMLLLLARTAYSLPIHDLPLTQSSVGHIHTALGFSTVIQLPSKPLNVVLGDQSSFKVEYINDSITIKPTRSNAHSNLFIYTERDRYSLALESGDSKNVDYVVKVKRIFEDSKVFQSVQRTSSGNGISVKIVRKLILNNEMVLDLQITNIGKNKRVLNPQDFRFLSAGKILSVRSLYLESLELEPNKLITGSFIAQDTKLPFPYRIILGLKGEKALKLDYPLEKKKVAKGGINAFQILD